MSVPTIAQVTAVLQSQGAARAIHEDDVIAVILALQAGGALWKVHPGATPYAQAVVGSSWQLVECWTHSRPSAGGRGILPSTATHRMTVETGGDGDWSTDWSVYLGTDEPVELGIRLNGSGVGLIGGTEATTRNTVSVQCLDPVDLEAGDYLELVARAQPGETANISIYTAHLWQRRELPS